jgi:hypothetical protein
MGTVGSGDRPKKRSKYNRVDRLRLHRCAIEGIQPKR